MEPVKRVVIVGGGTAGWITAALIAKLLGRVVTVELVESEEIGIIGVGEATIPPIQSLNRALGLDEAAFVKATQGTIKLGIQFEGWGEAGQSYMHAFGEIGSNFPFSPFHHFWVRDQQQGGSSSYWDYSLNYQAARANRFAPVARIADTDLPGLSYAYHFDASLYAAHLRRFAESLGVRRSEGRIVEVNLDPEGGDIRSIRLEAGAVISGDLFVDCSGFRGLLIEGALRTGYEDWSHWLPCDRAIAVPSAGEEALRPYTRSIAHHAGWQWRIPLQHRQGNGIVSCRQWMDDDEARALLLGSLDGEALGEPRQISFRPGRRRKSWNRNCVAIGLSSGFLEPLESTSIHLIQSAAVRLVKCFPRAGIRPELVEEFNRQTCVEYEHIRDFIILHYHLNQRRDGALWLHARSMDIPQSLKLRLALFRASGRVFREQDELFSETAWQQVMIGQNLIPEDYHVLADALSAEQMTTLMDSLKILIEQTVGKLPRHEAYLKGMAGSLA